MPLSSNGEIIDDGWVRHEDGAPLPADGDLILSFEQLLKEGEELAARRGRTGVELTNATDVEEIESLLPYLALVTLEFPAFTDGRAYSQARQLRATLGYTGELRATGNVLADQAAFMWRVGFDSFDIGTDVDIEVWKNASRAISLAYQRGYEGDTLTRDHSKQSGTPSPAI